MAKSFLAAQIEEIRGGLRGLAGDLTTLGEVNSQVLSRSMGVQVANPGGGGGGGGLPPGTILDQSGSPVGGASLALPTSGGSIRDFLERAAAAEAARNGSSASGGSGAGSSESGGRTMPVAPPTESEKSVMKMLNEGVEYVRKLVSAAKWAGISMHTIFRSSKQERDALIAAYEAFLDSGTSSGKSTGGAQNNNPPWWEAPDKLGPEWTRRFIDSGGGGGGLSSGGGGGGSGFTPGGNGGVTGGAPQFNNNPFQSQMAAPTPTAGDRFVADAVGGVTKAIDKLASKIDSNGGLSFRTKGL